MADISKINMKAGFFDAIGGDRTYSPEDMTKPYKRLISEGIFAKSNGSASSDFKVTSANNGMNIIVKKGEGILSGKWFSLDNDITLTVPTNTNVVPRRDSVIIQIDNKLTSEGRTANVVYRTGVSNSNPMPPDINTVDGVYEKRVANIYVSPNAQYIGVDAIVDLRGSTELPWITSLVLQPDLENLYNNWNNVFEQYFYQEKASFEAFLEEVSSNLNVTTNLVKYESHYVTSANNTTSIPINIAPYNKLKDILIVRINGFFMSEEVDYTIAIDSSSITLTKPLQANQSVDFFVLQSVIIGDPTTVMEALETLSEEVSNIQNDSAWINFILENGNLKFDETSTPGVRKYGNQVFLRGAIKGFNSTGATICTLPVSFRPTMNHQYTMMTSGGISVLFEIKTTGELIIVSKSGTISNTSMLPITTTYITG